MSTYFEGYSSDRELEKQSKLVSPVARTGWKKSEQLEDMLRSARVDRTWCKRELHGWTSWCALFGVRLATRAIGRGLRTLDAPSSEITHVTQGDIRGVLSANKCQYVVGHASFLIRCPFCEKGQKNSEKTLFVNKTTGSVVCKPCGVRGNVGI